MKRLISFLLAVSLLLTCALAETADVPLDDFDKFPD